MDTTFIPALAALGGAALGGFTSFATSWTTLRAQMKSDERASSKEKRQKLYKQFIDHASKLYGDALIHNNLELSGVIDLYALISRMRVISSASVVEQAVKVTKVITHTFDQPNKTAEELRALVQEDSTDLLLGFSEACRLELE